MTALFAGLTTVDVLHGLDHTPDPTLKTTSTDFLLAAGGPATNAAVTYASLTRIYEASAAPETLSSSNAALASSATLVTAIGQGALAQVLREDLHNYGVTILDATATTPAAQDDGNANVNLAAQTSNSPAISSIIDHPTGRMVASTNARVTTNPDCVRGQLPPDARVIMVDGHNPELALLALTSQMPDTSDDTDLMADFTAQESYQGAPRILDGGSWKPWLTPLLHHIDIAVISADFAPPLCAAMDRQSPEFALAVVEFLRGFGITKVVRTRGPEPVQWWWDDAAGEVPVPQVHATSTLGAGDIFHGAFTWALEHAGAEAPDPRVIIECASRVAALSTTHFGTRSWVTSPELADIISDFHQAQRAGAQ